MNGVTTAGGLHEVLVVDDEESICEFLTRALKNDNFRVTAMTDPSWVKEAVAERNPCLVIMDVHMPGRSGLDVLREIREASPELPVVMISGDGDQSLRDEARRVGACEFMSKPINWNYLRNIAHLSVFLKESPRR
jgi:DNA-binding NtrC family response regulator